MSIRTAVRTSIQSVLSENVMELVAEAMGSDEVKEMIQSAVVDMISEELKLALAPETTGTKPALVADNTQKDQSVEKQDKEPWADAKEPEQTPAQAADVQVGGADFLKQIGL